MTSSASSTPANSDASAPGLPERVAIRTWIDAFSEKPSPVLTYQGSFTYTAADDVVDNTIATDTPDAAYPVNVMCQVSHSGMGFRVRGHIQATLPFVCDRTLEVFTKPVDISVEERFLIVDNLPKEYHEEEWVTQYADESDAYNKNDDFDLKDWVRQWVVLETSGRHVANDTSSADDDESDDD